MRTVINLMLMAALSYPCLYCSKAVPGHAPTEPTSEKKTMLALGDSYTIGQSVDEALRFPNQAVAQLDSVGIMIQPPEYVARTGWTTTDLADALNHAVLRSSYDFVTLLIGVNDQYQGRDISQYHDRFAALLGRAIRYAGGQKAHVMVISIPDYSITPFVPQSSKASVRSEVEAYNAINAKITRDQGCKYLDITDQYRQGAGDPAMIADDQLHPSGNEYAKWAALIAAYIQTAP